MCHSFQKRKNREATGWQGLFNRLTSKKKDLPVQILSQKKRTQWGSIVGRNPDRGLMESLTYTTSSLVSWSHGSQENMRWKGVSTDPDNFQIDVRNKLL